jgi:glucoamylase
MAGAILLVGAASALACPASAVVPEEPNGIELLNGATNVNAALGSGRLTAGFSRCGELTVLKWPGPSYYDQLDYLSSNAPDARTLPHLGALPTHGAFPGLAWRGRDGRGGFIWLRDEAWTHRQRYAGPESTVLVDEATNPALGLRIIARHFVLPDADVLVNHYEVEREPGSPVRRATLVFYANFAPTMSRLPYFPIADSALDFENDFAVVYDRRHRALLHFLPASAAAWPRDYGVVQDLLSRPPRSRSRLQRAVDRLVRGLDEPGVYLALGARPHDDGFQAGFDDAPTCEHESALAERTVALFGLPPALVPLARSLFVCNAILPAPGGPLAACRTAGHWTWEAESAWADAADGRLSRSPLAACQANGALARRLRFRNDRATATFDLAVAGTRTEAYDALAAVRAGDVDAQRAATDAWWADFLAPLHLPDTDDVAVTTFAKRALMSIRTATDSASGAIVASITTQSPYGEDWPRDGAFINQALDRAGLPEVVSRHNRFYARVQRRQPSGWSLVFGFPPCNPAAPVYPNCVPAGTWEMNYYADPAAAVAGGPISFEIDVTGLAVWTLTDHARFLSDPGERAAYLADVCPAIARGAAALAACRDETTGLQCPANEDDNLPLTQGLQGAETVLLGLRSAAAAGPDCGFDPGEVAAWETRAAELADVIRERFLVPGPPAHFEGGRTPWVLWPAEVVSATDPLAASHAAWLETASIDPLLDRSAVVVGYNSEALLARARLFRTLGDAAGLAASQEHVRRFVHELTTADTGHMAEFSVRVQADLNGDGVAPDYLPTNAVPHVWEQAILYLAAMEAFGAR